MNIQNLTEISISDHDVQNRFLLDLPCRQTLSDIPDLSDVCVDGV